MRNRLIIPITVTLTLMTFVINKQSIQITDLEEEVEQLQNVLIDAGSLESEEVK